MPEAAGTGSSASSPPPAVSGRRTGDEMSGTGTTSDSSHKVDVVTADVELVNRLRAGDGEAFGEIVERYGDRLYAMLYQLACGDAELAAEFTQEAFVRAYERLDRFDGRSGFYTWLYRLARNRAIDLLAKKRPRPMSDGVLESAAGVGHDPGPDHALQREEARRQVQRALADLADVHREIILLRDFDDLDYQAIAELLGIAEGTVKSRLNRARAALRGELRRQGWEPGP